eukprot:scaffold80092_cov33-Tisochrysis_lutea.AAC.3
MRATQTAATGHMYEETADGTLNGLVSVSPTPPYPLGAARRSALTRRHAAWPPLLPHLSPFCLCPAA